jgi:REP element-mobilizing transposase RayT
MNTWDDNEYPLAYLITFRTYGTWLHGDERDSVDLRGQNIYGAPRVHPNKQLSRLMVENMKHPPFKRDGPQRAAVEAAIREVSEFKSYGLSAVNVRTNHVHSVVHANSKPEPVANALKAYATRRLRIEGLVQAEQKIWSRGVSTRYLWQERSVELAIDYVLNGQGEDLPDF